MSAPTVDLWSLDQLEGLAEVLTEEERGNLQRRFPRLTLVDAVAVLTQRRHATDVRPYVAWLRDGRRVRHGEHGIVLPQRVPGVPRARVFDVDQTDPEPSPAPAAGTGPGAGATTREAYPVTQPSSPASSGMSGPLGLATCSYSEFRSDMGVPIRFTAGYPRFLKLDYRIAGHAKLVTPTRATLALGADKGAYTVAYLRQLEEAGIDAIRDEIRRITDGRGRAVLLCFERLNETDRTTRQPKWCHRTIFANWVMRQAGEDVPELGAVPHGHAPASLF
jgi:hypothetical protein